MKFATFDLEILDEIPEGKDWKEVRPLRISCAGVAWSPYKGAEPRTSIWEGKPALNERQGMEIVNTLSHLEEDGYTIVTWNGCYFDFPVLADLCQGEGFTQIVSLNMHHVDMMLLVTFTKGYYLSLQSALKGAGVEGKLKEVTLKDGTILTDMDGSKAPQLWKDGEYEAVVEYLKSDITQPLELAHIAEERKEIRWTSQRGNPMLAQFAEFYPVNEIFTIPQPDTSWMTDPPKRLQFVDWMPEDALKELTK